MDTKVKEKEEWPINGNCDHCGQLGRLDEAGKAAMTQREGQFFKGSQKEEQWDERILEWTIVDKWELWKGWKRVPDMSLAQTQYGKGFDKQKGLNEVSGWSQDVWDLNGIHALTAVPSQPEFTRCSFTKPRSIVVAPCQPVTARNRFEVLSLGDEERESRESEFRERNPETHFRMEHVLKAFPTRAKQSAEDQTCEEERFSTERKITNRFKQSLQDFMQKETISKNGWEEQLDQPVAQHPIAFLGNLEPSDTGLRHVQDVGGYCWKLVSSIVDFGAINSVAPPDVSSVPMTESQAR